MTWVEYGPTATEEPLSERSRPSYRLLRLPDADAVCALLARMEADGVPILERWDEPGYVAFKCLDPDGWRVEAYWEPVG